MYQKYGIQLKPVEESDADFIIELRTNNQKSRFISATNPDVTQQKEWIKDYSQQLSIFPDESPNRLLHLNHSTFMGVKYRYFYQQTSTILDKIGLDTLPALLRDLAIIRIFEPASKLRSLELLNHF